MFVRTYPVMNAVQATRRVSGAQTLSPNVNFLYRVKGASLVGECLAATSKTLKTQPHVSGLSEFLQSRAVVHGSGPTAHQVRMDLSNKQLKFLLEPQRNLPPGSLL
ncbi:unnamed protein product [Lasius platythorax]|uniref:Uncharacterized protein n=1 Tax=Lasius platythorax TaxID=488582 RepID=A0AAV2NNX0_9HYME